MNKKSIVIATGNKGKFAEFQSILKSHFDKIYSLSDFDKIPSIEETGSTFRENAFIKANAVSELLGVDTIADDSGLSVDALDGAPGIFSARYSGRDANDENNNNKLLSALNGIENRQARFICSIAYYKTSGEIHFFDGECNGIILDEKRGNKGFGYDPVFYLPEYKKTMAEINPDIKNKISHRAKALSKLILFLDKI